MQHYFLLFVLLISCEVKPESVSRINLTSINKNDHFPKFLITKKNSQIKCESNEDCSMYFENLECIEGVCKCADSLILSSDGTTCLKSAQEYGSPCEDNIQCSKVLSIGGSCIDNECRCKPGYHYLKGSCWKNKGLGETCGKEEHCFSNYEYRGLECKNQVCHCKKEYYERFNSGCRRIRRKGESCNIDSDCPKGSTCEKMICTDNSKKRVYFRSSSNSRVVVHRNEKKLDCPKGKFELNEKCVLELGMPCSEDNECNHTSKASCIDRICTCKLVTYVPKENNRECITVARGKIQEITKSSCKENVQCGVFGSKSFCNGRTCDCEKGTYFEVENQLCWEIKRLGEQCSSDKDCYSTNSTLECQRDKKVCACREGFIQAGDTCVTESFNIGDKCESHESCRTKHSYCNITTQTCRCKEHYYEEGKKCKAGVGSHCNTDKDCSHLNNTICDPKKNSCQCQELHVSQDEFKYCLPGAKHNETCIESFQCRFYLGEYGQCVNKTCRCSKHSHYANEKCHRTKSVGEKCMSRSECAPGDDPDSVLCFKGFCTCNFGFVVNDVQICVSSKSGPVAKIYPLLLVISFVMLLKV